MTTIDKYLKCKEDERVLINLILACDVFQNPDKLENKAVIRDVMDQLEYIKNGAD